jgi:hypothetical protein
MWAMVVFPVPGAPQRIMDGILPCSMAVRKMLPLPVRCCCPTSSSNVDGLTRSAKGTDAFILQISEEYWNPNYSIIVRHWLIPDHKMARGKLFRKFGNRFFAANFLVS